MENKKYQVFISSTYIDLIEERRSILDILLMADCIPAGMEAFVATDDEQFEVIKRVIDLCDYYVLIIGKRYGSVNGATGISYTEMEYEYAKEKNIPVLVFAIDNSVELSDDKIEKLEESQVKLAAFRSKAMDNRLASIWKNASELTGQLAVAIMRAKSEIVRPGWQRGANYDEASLRRELMELRSENDELVLKLNVAHQKLDSFNTQTNIAFENVEIPFDFHIYGTDNKRYNKHEVKLLKDIFIVISTQMMDVALTETAVGSAIKTSFSSRTVYFHDTQVIKKNLNQLRALGLIYSTWNTERKSLYWGLTAKGIKVRDDEILIKKDREDVLLEEMLNTGE